LWGYVLDGSGNGVSGYRVHAGVEGFDWAADSLVTGSDGFWDILLAGEARAGAWYAYVIDGAGTQVSPRSAVRTDAGNCEPGGSGIQTVYLEYRR
jgi:hypothetical protein